MEALDSGKLTLNQKVTAGPTALDNLTGNYSTANIKIGDSLTVEQLLYCLLLPSANEAANILAVAVDGSIDGFVEHMNQRAKELGMIAIFRTFVIDSMALEALLSVKTLQPDAIDILPGLMPTIIRKVRNLTGLPVLAGGLITEKQEVLQALEAGALAISSTAGAVWDM